MNTSNNNELSFTLYGDPLYQQRHRLARGRMYDPMSRFKEEMRERLWELVHRIDFNGYFNAPIACELLAYYPLPKSLSKRKKRALLKESFKSTKPDLDNVGKLYLDVCNGIFYQDDAIITQLYVEKRYSVIPRVEIKFYPAEDRMIEEHAITYKDALSAEDLSYIVKKANRLGIQDRQIASVYTMEDDEGKHLYFSVENIHHGGER